MILFQIKLGFQLFYGGQLAFEIFGQGLRQQVFTDAYGFLDIPQSIF
jgi:hypothetical protein